MRTDCIPSLIDPENQIVPLSRVQLDDRKIAESYLQEIIHASPSILPIARLDRNYSPPVSIGREIVNIDNLLISPAGKITIVETKLWRNPQSAREVIAQAVDYASILWEMGYEEFEEICRKALPPAPLQEKSLYELVKAVYPTLALEEAAFHDEVQKCLNNAEFLLFIVGDGIRENLENMADLLYRPQMHFKLGLVEIQIYESPVISQRLVIPNLVAHSTEIKRTLIKVEGGGKATVSVNIEEHPTPASKGRRTLSEDEFFAELKEPEAASVFRALLEFGREIGAVPDWKASSVGLRLPDPRGIHKPGFTLFLLNLDGTVSDSYLGYQLSNSGGEARIADNRALALSKIFGIPYSQKYNSLERSIPWQQVAEHFEEFKDLLRQTVNQIRQMLN